MELQRGETAGPPAIEGYRVLRWLGGGALAETWIAQRAPNEMLALKIVRPELSTDGAFIRDLELDLPLVAHLLSDHIAKLVEFGRRGEHYCLASQLIDGDNLNDLPARFPGGKVPWPVVESLAAMLLKALDAAHLLDVVHGGLKPANLIVSPQGLLKVTDFGIARALDGDLFPLDALSYLSPEQAVGGAPTKASDLFTAGVLFYEWLSGTKLFSELTAAEMRKRIATPDPTLLSTLDPTIPAWLEAWVHRLLRPEPEHRPTAAQALADLQQHSPQPTPDLVVRDALRDPSQWHTGWSRRQAHTFFEAGKSYIEWSPTSPMRGYLALFRAHLLSPGATPADALLRELYRGSDPFASARTPAILSLETAIQQQPRWPDLYTKLGNECLANGDLLQAIASFKRAALLNPTAAFPREQLHALIGEEANPFDSLLSHVASSPPARPAQLPVFALNAPPPLPAPPPLSAARAPLVISTAPPAPPAPSTPRTPPSAPPAPRPAQPAPLEFPDLATSTAATPEPKPRARAPSPRGVYGGRSKWADRWPTLAFLGVLLLAIGGVVHLIGKTIADSQKETVDLTERLAAHDNPNFNHSTTAHLPDEPAKAPAPTVADAPPAAEAAEDAAPDSAAKLPQDVVSDRAASEVEYKEALKLYNDGNHEGAERALLALRRQHPATPRILDVSLLLGRIYVAREDWKSAEPELSRYVLEMGGDPSVQEVRWLWAQALAGTTRPADAIHQCENFLDHDRTSPMFARVTLFAAKQDERLGNLNTALARYRGLLERQDLTPEERSAAKEGLTRVSEGR